MHKRIARAPLRGGVEGMVFMCWQVRYVAVGVAAMDDANGKPWRARLHGLKPVAAPSYIGKGPALIPHASRIF